MIRDKMLCFFESGESEVALYDTFMKLGGPYWMSCVTKNDAVPILDPDEYLGYPRE